MQQRMPKPIQAIGAADRPLAPLIDALNAAFFMFGEPKWRMKSLAGANFEHFVPKMRE
jgi:hypothetical protein